MLDIQVKKNVLLSTYTHFYRNSSCLTQRYLEKKSKPRPPKHITSVMPMEPRAEIVSTTGARTLPLPFHFHLMPSPFLHLVWSKGHTRCAGISSTCCQSQVIFHAFTTAFHPLLSCTSILSCSADITLSISTFHTIHPSCVHLINFLH